MISLPARPRWSVALLFGLSLAGCTPKSTAAAAPPSVQVDPSLVAGARATDGSVAFAAFGDTDWRSGEGQRKVSRAVAAVCAAAGCDFVLLLGDNIYPTGVGSDSDPLFQESFEKPYADVKAPFLVVLGNHDYAPTRAGIRADRAIHEVEYSKHSTKWRMPATRWHEVHGPVELVGLDTTVELYGQGGTQAQQAEAWLKDSKAPWKIAIAHHPYLSNGPHGNAGTEGHNPDGGPNGEWLKTFLDRVVCGHADVYLTGHDHNQQWLTPTCQGTELIVSGASANNYELSSTNPSRFQSDQLGFFYARVTAKTFTGYFVDANGEVEFSRMLQK